MNRSDSVSTYEPIASEYYNPVLHPTCANFNELSRLFLRPRIAEISKKGLKIVEVGAGYSIAASILYAKLGSLDNLIITDNSPAMLAHSGMWKNFGAHLLNCDARNIPLANESADVIIASLGDPYNHIDFWNEVSRVLVKGGKCLFSIPTPEWAERFRQGFKTVAEFYIGNGQRVLVNSFIPSADQQHHMITHSGLMIYEVTDLCDNSLTQPPSAKLKLDGVHQHQPIVRGYAISK